MSAETINTIAIELDSSANKALINIGQLTASLQRLQSSAKLNQTAKNLRNLASAIGTLRQQSTGLYKLNQLVSDLNKLASVKQMDGFTKTVKTLKELPKAAEGVKSISAIDSSKFTELSAALAPLSEVGSMTNFGKAVKQLKALPEVTKAIEGTNMERFATAMQKVTAATAPLSAQMRDIAEGFRLLPNQVQKALKKLDQYSAKATKAAKSTSLLDRSLAGVRLRSIAAELGYAGLIHTLGESLKASNERVEDLNLFVVSMGEYAEEAYEYAQLVQQALGVNASEWAKKQGVFMQLGSGFGMAKDQAYALSKGLTELTYDLASFYNLDLDEAYNKVKSAIVGEIEPIRALGASLDMATLQEKALEYGITKKVNAMTQAEKAELRYLVMTESLSNAIGDMARTISSPANALRILQSQFLSLKQAIGDLVAVMLTPFIPVIQAVVIALTNLIQALASLVGYDTSKLQLTNNFTTTASALGDAADSANDTASGVGKAAKEAKELKQYMMGWDELNVIDPTVGDTGSGSNGGGGVTVGGSGLGLPLDSLWEEGMLKKLSENASGLVPIFERLIELAALLGAGFAAWKLANKIHDIKALGSALTGFKKAAAMAVIGAVEFAWEFDSARKYLENGAPIDLISFILGALGGCAAFTWVTGSATTGIALGLGIAVVASFAAQTYEIAKGSFDPWAVQTVLLQGVTNMFAGIVGMKMLKSLGKGGGFFAGASIAFGIQMLFNTIDSRFDHGMNIGNVVSEAIGLSALAAGLKYATKGAVGGGAFFAIFVADIGIHLAISLLSDKDQNIAKQIFDRENLKAAAADFVADCAQTIRDLPGDLQDAWDTLIGIVKDKVDWVFDKINQFFDKAFHKIIPDIHKSAEDVGYETIEGVADGFRNDHPLLTGVFDVVSKIIGFFRKDLEIGSPSKKMRDEVGKYIIEGIKEGIIVTKMADAIATWYNSTKAEFDSKISELNENAKTKFADLPNKAKDAIDGFKDKIPEWKAGVSSKFDTEIGALKDEVKGFFNGLPSKAYAGIQEKISELENAGKYFVQGVIKGITTASGELFKAIQNMGGSMLQKLKDKLGIASPSKEAKKIGGFFAEGLEIGVSDGTKDALAEIDSLGEEIKSTIENALSFKGDESEDFFEYGKYVSLSMSGGVKAGAPYVYNALKAMGAEINNIMAQLVSATQAKAAAIISAAVSAREAAASIGASSSTTSSTKISSSPTPLGGTAIHKKAAGGTVPTGELFVAREAGPELVGSVGRTTSVMNNEQIVEAVSQGVASAVSAVMGNYNGASKVQVYLDGKQIYANQKEVARKRGVEFNMGAFAR